MHINISGKIHKKLVRTVASKEEKLGPEVGKVHSFEMCTNVHSYARNR